MRQRFKLFANEIALKEMARSYTAAAKSRKR
jgi:hypothetical protein